MLAGGVVMAASRRQHCIAMSSTEAELIALGDLALELLYLRGQAESLGLDVAEAIETFTDNKGAYDLCRRFSSANHSRHVERKVFKMRQLRGAGVTNVSLVSGDSNPADLFTKIVSKQLFDKYRKFVIVLGTQGAP